MDNPGELLDRIAELERKNETLADRRLDMEILAENRGLALLRVKALAESFDKEGNPTVATLIRNAARVPDAQG